jgi:hypothetical protein
LRRIAQQFGLYAFLILQQARAGNTKAVIEAIYNLPPLQRTAAKFRVAIATAILFRRDFGLVFIRALPLPAADTATQG